MDVYKTPTQTSENSLVKIMAPVLGGTVLVIVGIGIEAIPLLPSASFNLPRAALGIIIAGIGYIIAARAAHQS